MTNPVVLQIKKVAYTAPQEALTLLKRIKLNVTTELYPVGIRNHDKVLRFILTYLDLS